MRHRGCSAEEEEVEDDEDDELDPCSAEDVRRGTTVEEEVTAFGTRLVATRGEGRVRRTGE